MTACRIDEEQGAAVVGDDQWVYRFGARRRPFLHPVSTPAGHCLTRDAPEDHPWHHGLWFTIKYVNDENFWEEYDAYGVLRHTSPPRGVGRDDGKVEVAGTLDWIRPDRETVVLREARRLTHRPIDDTAYAIDFHTQLVPDVDVLLDRTEFTTWGGYGGLAFRGRGDFHDTRILLDDGAPRDRVLGDRSPWLDLSGFVGGDDGDVAAGVTFLDSPTNTVVGGGPVPWYGSNRAATYGNDENEEWGNFFNAAFLWDGSLEVEAGATLAFDYRVIIHDGIWDADRVAAEHGTWLDDVERGLA